MTTGSPQQQRRELADRLIAGCPDHLNAIALDEIALTGSTARGLADDASDLELNLFTLAPLPTADLIAWLTSAGAVDLEPEPAPRDDDSRWVAGMLDDIPIEVGNQTFAELARLVTRLTTDPDLPLAWLALGELLTSAVPLRTRGAFAAAIAPLHTFPPALRDRLLRLASDRLARRDPAGAARLLARGEWIALAEQVSGECAAALTGLYALNGRWQPSRKWTLTGAAGLVHAPDRLVERIGAFTSARTPHDLAAGYAVLDAIMADLSALLTQG